MDARDSNDPLARYEAMVAAYEALASEIAERVSRGSAASAQQAHELDRLRKELEACRHAAWFKAFWELPPADPPHRH